MPKLWLDDIRMPPSDEWLWARTYGEAKTIAASTRLTEMSLDCDLGLHEVDPTHPDAWLLRGTSPDGSGLDFVKWLVRESQVPPRARIHSWNLVDGMTMAHLLADHGCEVLVSPFQASEVRR